MPEENGQEGKRPRETPSSHLDYKPSSLSNRLSLTSRSLIDLSEPMPKTNPDEHREASEVPPSGESVGEPSSRGSRPLTDNERSGLIEDARRFKESHESSFRLLSREGASRESTSREGTSREGTSRKNVTSEDQ
jgi:hypothetical protein